MSSPTTLIPIKCWRHKIPLGDCEACMDRLATQVIRDTLAFLAERVVELERLYRRRGARIRWQRWIHRKEMAEVREQYRKFVDDLGLEDNEDE